jgi:hypothetical protein
MRLRVQRREPCADATAEMEVPALPDGKPVAVLDDD